MPRISFLFRTDTHVSDRSPESWKGDYPSEIWSNLEQVAEFAKGLEVTAVLDGGDYFHVKSASRNSHSLVAKSAKIHKNYPCPVYCVEGNHDLSSNNLETLDKQPLAVLYESKVFNHLRNRLFKDGDMRVRVVGVPYSPFRTLDELRSIQKKPGDTHLVAVVHSLASLNPPASVEDFFGEPVFRYEDLVTPDGPDVWMFGHWHRDQGVEQIGGKSFVNQGALSRGALIKENLERIPQIAYVEFDGSDINIQTLSIDVAPAQDVFDLELKAAQEQERRDIDQFIMNLVASSAVDPANAIEDNIKAMDVATEVREAALHYLGLVG